MLQQIRLCRHNCFSISLKLPVIGVDRKELVVERL